MPMTDEEVARQILNVFHVHRVGSGGSLKRPNFVPIRDGDFRRGMDSAISNDWVKQHERDRYRWVLTDIGKAAANSGAAKFG